MATEHAAKLGVGMNRRQLILSACALPAIEILAGCSGGTMILMEVDGAYTRQFVNSIITDDDLATIKLHLASKWPNAQIYTARFSAEVTK
jgi:hypothetical protein